MKDSTKIIITGLIVLFAIAFPITGASALWVFAMHHIPVAETALRVLATVGCVGLGGWFTFIIGALAATLAVTVITAAE